MANIVISGDTSGAITLAAPAIAGTTTLTLPTTSGTIAVTGDSPSFTNLAYTGTLTGGTGVINIGSGQIYKDASGNVGIGTSSPAQKLDVNGATARFSNGSYVGYLGAGSLLVSGGSTDLTLRSDNVLSFGTGGPYERMRIDSSGNVGIGATPSAWTSTNKAVQIGAGGALIGRTDTNAFVNLAANYYFDGTNNRYIGSNFASIYSQSNGEHLWYSAPSGTAGATVSFTERMRIDSSGNVGIGTSVTNARMTVLGGVIPNPPTGAVGISGGLTTGRFGTYDAGTLGIIGNAADATSFEFIAGSSGGYYAGMSITGSNATLYQGTVRFATAGTERMRIDSSGNLLVGTTTAIAYTKFTVLAANGGSALSATNTSGTSLYYAAAFYNNGTSYSYCGGITVSGSTTSYSTSSDYRLKENITPMTGALGVVQQLKPVTYKWKVDGSDGQGFIAHELQAVVPDCVTGEKDAVDEEGKPVYQGIDTSFLVATLTKAIQELKEQVDAQALEIQALKGTQ